MPRSSPPPWAPKRFAKPSRRQRSRLAVVFHGQHVPTPTAAAAWRANTAVSNAACWPWPGDLWPWLVTGYWCLTSLNIAQMISNMPFDCESGVHCPSNVWHGLPRCGAILVFLGLSVLDLGPMYATDRQTSDSIIAKCPRLGGGV